MIVTQELTKIYRKGRPAVDGLSLTMPAGAVTGLLGLNGAGKTTTIKMLATLLRPTSGTATIDGLDVVRSAREVRRRINLIAGGERMVYARMTGRENLWYFGQLYDVPRATLRTRTDDLLALVGLEEAAGTLVERYSRGMRQRLSIARGLINAPSYLLLDEPTLGLDAPIARDLRAVVADLARNGVGVLLTSHYLAEVEELCRTVYVIDGGVLIADDTPAALTAGSRLPHTVELTLAAPAPAVAEAVEKVGARAGAEVRHDTDAGGLPRVTVRHVEDLTGEVTTAAVRAGAALVRVEVKPPTLEDAILEMARPSVARS